MLKIGQLILAMNGLLKVKNVRILFISQSLLLKGIAN